MSENNEVERYTMEDALKDILGGLRILNTTDGLINEAVTAIQQQMRIDEEKIRILQGQVRDLQRDVERLRAATIGEGR